MDEPHFSATDTNYVIFPLAVSSSLPEMITCWVVTKLHWTEVEEKKKSERSLSDSHFSPLLTAATLKVLII